MARRFVRVGAVKDVAPGEVKPVEVDGERIVLCNVDGDLYAVCDECTHEAFPLSAGMLDEHRLTCGLHGACFDIRTGEVLALPAMESIRTYDVRVSGEDIEVALD